MVEETAPAKMWYESLTLWTNTIAGLAIGLQLLLKTEVLPMEAQAALLTVINVLLRIITKKPVAFS